MRSPASRLVLGLAALAATWTLVLPVGAMLLQSFRVEEVVATDGRTFRSAGEIEVDPVSGDVTVWLQDDPRDERVRVGLSRAQVREVRTRWGTDHLRAVFGDPRNAALLKNSLLHAGGGALLALLLGVPLAWLLVRTNLPGRRVLRVLCLGPAILPPFLAAMGASKPIGTWIGKVTGLVGDRLQLVNGIVLFGLVLFPVVLLLVGRAFANVPAGPYEAARLLGGRRAAARTVVVPALLPAVVGSFAVVFVLALSDFGVPDLLSFVLPPSGSGVHVYAKEIQVQWSNAGNQARAVATGAPLLVTTAVLFAVALVLLRKSPAAQGPIVGRGLAPHALSGRGRAIGWICVALVVLLALVLPIGGIVSWALGHGETAAAGTSGRTAAGSGGTLFDLPGAIRNTPGVMDDWARWIKTSLAAAIVSALIAIPLARAAVRGGRLARAGVLGLAGLSLATPGLVLGIGTMTTVRLLGLGSELAGAPMAVSALVGRFLPYALLACWLAFREIPKGYEEAARTLGAGPLVRARSVWGPLGLRGVLTGLLLVFLLALRELDAIVLIEPQVFPLRLYDKIHYSRRADEANLALLYLLHLLVPAVGAAWLGSLRPGAAESRDRRFHRGASGGPP